MYLCMCSAKLLQQLFAAPTPCSHFELNTQKPKIKLRSLKNKKIKTNVYIRVHMNEKLSMHTTTHLPPITSCNKKNSQKSCQMQKCAKYMRNAMSKWLVVKSFAKQRLLAKMKNRNTVHCDPYMCCPYICTSRYVRRHVDKCGGVNTSLLFAFKFSWIYSPTKQADTQYMSVSTEASYIFTYMYIHREADTCPFPSLIECSLQRAPNSFPHRVYRSTASIWAFSTWKIQQMGKVHSR